ncbi:transporter substrate-binding domain-containing protein [Pseudomonas sp. RP23018S]|uniref:transporter substrate-binding domain-containing protein n=1 Tax=Pseudomonas sp. RP23018S TaxID=3096037 RepID=UPI002ACA86FE|nr:transporter substrate-binding domain-containing protein [Pseudomonas sp. RP23018S]MDZ5601623.1 transporter substrate-binding domain-containing protein [Pseudomonas sp. RP23018S]
MSKYLAGLFLALVFTSLASHAREAPPDAHSYLLLSRASAQAADLPLTPQQRRWISNRQRLVVGTTAPDNPPFDITLGGREYQGLTADYVGLIGSALGLPVEILRLPTRQAAIDALKRGQIDLLGSANGYEAAAAGLVLSQPYAFDQTVLVTREDETRPLDMDLDGMRLSTLYHYLPASEMRAAYPGAQIQTYESTTQALNAVAFDQADVFIGDIISTHYQINQGHLPRLRMANFGKHEMVGFSFAVRQNETQLLELVNATLDSVPASTRGEISRRWGAGSDTLLTDRKLQLSQRENRWLRDHPEMRVSVNENAAPLSFLDNNGHLRGITADLLELIRLRTGLRFRVQRAGDITGMIADLQNGTTDIIATFAADEGNGTGLTISRPYLETSHVLVTRSATDQPATLDQLRGKRVAVSSHGRIASILATTYPEIVLVPTKSPFYSVALLNSGAVDAIVTTLIDANHALTVNDNLAIRTTVSSEPASFAMATAPHARELASILDKALLSITPEELGVIHSRWRSYSLFDDAQWPLYRRIILQVVLATAVLLVLALLWNARLRRQIKQRQVAERALNDQLEFMRALLNGTPHPMYVRDREGRLQSCNESYLVALNTTAEAVLGKRLEDSAMKDCAYTRQIQADYRTVMKQGKPLILDRPMRLNEEERTLYHWVLPYRDSLGEMQGIIGGWIDISDRRKLVQDLRLAKQQADDANRAKSTFLATISHEIRTPMNAVIGMLELALRRADEGELDRPAIEVAHQSAKDLLGLIGDILDVVRIESGHLSLTPEAVNPIELVESVGRVFDGLAREKGLALRVVIAPDAGCHARLDPLRFKQILSNLVSNAIKFTEQGQVRICVAVRERTSAGTATLDLDVHDTGIGISEDDLKRLFCPFGQVNPDSQQARNGTGLGLVISRNLCEMMGGSLGLESLQGVGTRVRLQMPLQLTAPPPAPAVHEDRCPPLDQQLQVMVIDDHPANLMLMAQQLSVLGLRHQRACDGREALCSWRDGHFDVLILDCNMPHMNGYQLARIVRAEEQLYNRSPCTIIGYTANAQPEARQQCLDAGMDDCLLKPISLSTLRQRLSSIRRAGAQPSPRPRLFDLSGLCAVVGDSLSDRERLLQTLKTSLQQDLHILMQIDPDQAPQALADQAHKILSAARMLEAHPLMAACEALHTPAHPAHLRQQRQRLARHMRRVEKALERELR